MKRRASSTAAAPASRPPPRPLSLKAIRAANPDLDDVQGPRVPLPPALMKHLLHSHPQPLAATHIYGTVSGCEWLRVAVSGCATVPHT